jgi:5'-nucleotidase
VIVGAAKPAFIQDDYLAIFKVDRSEQHSLFVAIYSITHIQCTFTHSNGQLRNIDDKDSLSPQTLTENKVFQAGCWQDLHRLLGVPHGDRILYVGDHIYADILRSVVSLTFINSIIISHMLALDRRELLDGEHVSSFLN